MRKGDVMEKITENVYVETGFQGCNTSFVVTSDGVVVIDTPMVPDDAKKWAGEAARHGPVRYVINSEPHTDHFSGNCYFGGTVIAHEGTRRAILTASVDDMKNMLKFMSPESPPPGDEFYYRPPDITLSERLTFYLGDHTFQLINMPGHTPYQVAVYVPEEKVVFSSDNVNLGMPYFGDSLPDVWLETLKRYQELDVDKVVPGHGDVAGKSSIMEMIAHLHGWIDPVANAISRGMSLEEIVEKIPADLPGEIAGMPEEGPMAGMLRTNIEKIYHYLKK
jgi:cyclase